jgi:hypothetical protein
MKKGVQFYTEMKEVNFKFMDLKGKDAGVNRYRIDCYYADGKAFTHFTYTPKQYYEFIASHIADCYETYDEFKDRKTAVQTNIDKIQWSIKKLKDEVDELSKQL